MIIIDIGVIVRGVICLAFGKISSDFCKHFLPREDIHSWVPPPALEVLAHPPHRAILADTSSTERQQNLPQMGNCASAGVWSQGKLLKLGP